MQNSFRPVALRLPLSAVAALAAATARYLAGPRPWPGPQAGKSDPPCPAARSYRLREFSVIDCDSRVFGAFLCRRRGPAPGLTL